MKEIFSIGDRVVMKDICGKPDRSVVGTVIACDDPKTRIDYSLAMIAVAWDDGSRWIFYQAHSLMKANVLDLLAGV